MQPPDDPRPSAPTIDRCYRHPQVQTGVHCTRCGRPICTECMIPAAVGYQCPECLAEARRDYRRGPGRPRVRLRGVSATKVLLVAILAGFAVEIVVGGPNALLNGPGVETLFDLGGMSPAAIAVLDQYWRLFTAMFIHAGLLHLGFNAYALWLFGTQVEDAYGTGWMLAVYVVSGLLASVTSYVFGPVLAVGVGASGAIFGIFGAFIAYNYRRRHLALAAANLRWAMTLILLNLLLAFSIRGIDWRAHAGGLVAGILAGAAAEGFGPRRTRNLVRVASFVLLIAVGVVAVVWRTGAIRALPQL